MIRTLIATAIAPAALIGALAFGPGRTAEAGPQVGAQGHRGGQVTVLPFPHHVHQPHFGGPVVIVKPGFGYNPGFGYKPGFGYNPGFGYKPGFGTKPGFGGFQQGAVNRGFTRPNRFPR